LPAGDVRQLLALADRCLVDTVNLLRKEHEKSLMPIESHDPLAVALGLVTSNKPNPLANWEGAHSIVQQHLVD
jgi:hypothetical protein